MARLYHLYWLTILVATLAACGSDGDTLETPAECNPLGGINCMTPWPSGIFQVEDSSSPTGFMNAVPAGTLPESLDGRQIDPELFLNKRSGFNPASPIMTAFPTGVDGSNLVHYSSYADSLTPASPTVLINADTGELVEHFAELDARASETPDKQALFIRSSTVLQYSTRYIVAIKNTLKAPGGADLPIPEGFAAILEDRETDHELLERARPRYEDIFTQLSAHGIERDSLVVAWDFVTLAKEETQREMIAARDRALEATNDGAALAYTVTSDEPHSDPLIRKRIEGTFTVPLLLSQDGNFTPETQLVRDADGLPMVVGMHEAPFVALVPECAYSAQEPIGMFIYGHGLLGDANQTGSSGPRHVAGRECLVAYGTDFRGFSERDLPALALVLNDFNKQEIFFPVQIQGVVNHIILTKTAQGPMADSLFVDGDRSLVDPEKVFYYGISQGGIMGGTVMAFDKEIKRAVLQVGAVNYSMLLERSLDWPTYRTILIGAYPDPLDVALLINLMQEFWDMDPANTVYDVLNGGIPDTPPKQLLLQMAVADDEVANVATEYQARTMGINTLSPSVYEPHGVPAAAGPLSSALVIYDYGLGDTIPLWNEAPPENDVHGQVRKQEACIDQIGEFFATGEIQQFCGESGCDCEGDGCGERL